MNINIGELRHEADIQKACGFPHRAKFINRVADELYAKTKALEELIEAADNFEKSMCPYSLSHCAGNALRLREQIANARKALGK